jgi:nucleotide-binding universal stress UspA family protein
MKKILCPVDFSAHSENAIRYACELAEKENAQLLLLYAFHVNPIDPNALDPEPVLVFELGKEYERMLMSLAERVRENNKGLKVQTIIRNGLAADSIPYIVKQEKVELVIMSTDGADGILSLFGTVAASVVEKTECPVWVIPADYKFKPIKEIVYATDLHGNESQAMLKIVPLAKMFDAHIAVLNIQKEEPENVKQVIEYALKNIVDVSDYKKISFQVNEESDVLEGISTFAERMNADVIVMTTHKRNFLERLSKKSATKQMSYHTKIPLLAFHKENMMKENIV